MSIKLRNVNVNSGCSDSEESQSQSSISLSKRTLPSVSLSQSGYQPLSLENYCTNASDSRQSMHSQTNHTPVPIPIMNPMCIHNSETEDIKTQTQIDTNTNNTPTKPTLQKKKRRKSRNKSEINMNKLNLIFDDKIFSKFDRVYKHSNNSNAHSKTHKNTQIKSMESVSSHTGCSITRIHNFRPLDLCYKETKVSCHNELKRCVNEYKALHRFYDKLHGTELAQQYCSLYINKKKGSTNYPKKVRLVMLWYEGEDLDDFLVDEEDGEVGFLYEEDFRAIMSKLLHQIHVCHKQGILHCDIKPCNIRINEQSDKYEESDPNYYDVNIIDFGFAHVFKSDRERESKQCKLSYIKGTPGFIAPETIKSKKYSVKTDMFSVGCVAFFLLTNSYAVLQSDDMSVEAMMPDRKRLKRLLKRENDRNRDETSRIHQKTIDFVLSCLWKNPSKRPTASQALKLKIFR